MKKVLLKGFDPIITEFDDPSIEGKEGEESALVGVLKETLESLEFPVEAEWDEDTTSEVFTAEGTEDLPIVELPNKKTISVTWFIWEFLTLFLLLSTQAVAQPTELEMCPAFMGHMQTNDIVIKAYDKTTECTFNVYWPQKLPEYDSTLVIPHNTGIYVETVCKDSHGNYRGVPLTRWEDYKWAIDNNPNNVFVGVQISPIQNE